MEREVIIGFQDTEQGADALALGRVFANALGARPVVATVLPFPTSVMGAMDLEEAKRAETETAFARAEEELRGLEPETLALANPSASNALYALAQERRAAMIVVGSTHRGTVGRILLGSVGRALLHGAPCAVAVAPGGYAPRTEHHLSHLGVAFDGSDEAEVALETAIALAERLHGRLSVFTVAEAERYGIMTATSILTEAEFRNFEREAKQRVLDAAVARVPDELGGEGHLLTGAPGPLLAGASAELDLLVLGSRGYGALRQTFLGSCAATVIDAASSPVLVVPGGEGRDALALRGGEGDRAS